MDEQRCGWIVVSITIAFYFNMLSALYRQDNRDGQIARSTYHRRTKRTMRIPLTNLINFLAALLHHNVGRCHRCGHCGGWCHRHPFTAPTIGCTLQSGGDARVGPSFVRPSSICAPEGAWETPFPFPELAIILVDGALRHWCLALKSEYKLVDTYKFNTQFIIWNHLHPDLKLEYVIEEELHTLWVALKGWYEQHKAILLS
jgi:hypothetical protein